MVRVTEADTLHADGSIDLDAWFKRVGHDWNASLSEQMHAACDFAFHYVTVPASACQQNCFSQGLTMAAILAALNPDPEMLVAALLFPAYHERKIEIEQVTDKFGIGVSKLLRGTKKMSSISGIKTRLDAASTVNMDRLRKMLLAMVEDARVVLIKLAEILCEARAAKYLDELPRRRLAKQLQDIYAPLANRLGVGQIKWEMEDLAFRYLEPETYKNIAKLLDEKRLDRERYIANIIDVLDAALKKEGIEAEVTGRVKHIYSIWRKMKRKNVSYDEIYDVRAVRILVPSVRDCYGALGIVHNLWQHIRSEFDDYVAMPKENGYRSLHTAVIGPQGRTLEVQIRTFKMHEDAELGVAAHWRYKEGVQHDPGYENKIAWLRQLLDWQKEVTNASDLWKEIRGDALTERVYVLTPKGDVVDLPLGSTPLDFAYQVHTDIGHRCKGTKVNGRIVPFTYKVQNGDQIEVLTGSQPNPSRDWMNANAGYLHTQRARAKVHAWFRRQDRDKNITEGRAIYERECNRLGLSGVDLDKAALKMKYPSHEDLLAGIGSGDVKITQVINYGRRELPQHEAPIPIIPIRTKTLAKNQAKNQQAAITSGDTVTVQGVDNLMTTIAGCCHPLPGDAVIGYITQGRGISIHRLDCPHMNRTRESRPERFVNVDWGQTKDRYPVDMVIIAVERPHLLRDITNLISNEHVNILGMNSRVDQKNNQVITSVRVELANLSGLGRLCEKLSQVPDVIDVKRSNLTRN